MNHFKKRTLEGNQWDVSALVCYRCPSCNMLTWHNSRFDGSVLCPFCNGGQPDYLTRIAPQTMERCDMSGNAQRSGESAALHDERSPFTVEFFMVQGAGFRCMAYRNHEGKWREAFNNEELPGAVRILE